MRIAERIDIMTKFASAAAQIVGSAATGDMMFHASSFGPAVVWGAATALLAANGITNFIMLSNDSWDRKLRRLKSQHSENNYG